MVLPTSARQQFGQHAEKYRKSAVHADQSTLDHIVQLLNPRGTEMALDVGCGGGHMTAALGKDVIKLIALDVTPQMLHQTTVLTNETGIGNVETCVGDAENLPFTSQIFDIVTCRIVLHHVPEARKAVQEMSRTLKIDGKLLIQDILGLENDFARNYMDKIERLRDPSHIKDYNRTEWHLFFESAGLKIRKVETIKGLYRLKDWTRRSGAPKKNVEHIIYMLENMPQEIAATLKATYIDEDWSIPMRYIVALATH